MDPIGSFSGLASGMQWRDMVDQIMQNEIARRINPVQAQVTAAEKRKEAWNSFNSLLTKFSASVRTFQDGSAFGSLQTTVDGSSSGKTLFSAVAGSTATSGSYRVKVANLATADKLGSAAFASQSEALGITGDFFVNGKRLEITATDTLTSVRNAINASNTGSNPSGVSATILSTSSTEHRLVLTSSSTGSRGIELVDGSTNALQALGVTTAARLQNTKPGDASSTQTQRFASTVTPLAAMLGVTSPPAVTTLDIDGHKITVDLENDTLLSLMNRIATAGGTASLDAETVGATTFQRLTVSGNVVADAAASDPAASQRVAELLGFQTGARASSITTGVDALVEIDGFQMSRRSNVISDAISGVTLTLQAEDPTAVNDLSVSRYHDSMVKSADAMVAAYNELVAFADAQRAAGSPLGSNSSLRSTMSSLSKTLLNGVSSLSATNPYSHLSMVGIELTKTGRLELNASKFRSALETNFADVQELMSSSGSVTDAELTYVSAGKTAVAGSYAVVITAAATKASHLGTAWSDPGAYAASNGISDTLTLVDSFSGKTINATVAQGTSLTALVAQLNSTFAAEGAGLVAEEEGGSLRISSNDFGSTRSFTISGSAAGSLGLSAASFTGSDVAGTIGGLAANGVGQLLTGATGGATDGIAVKYSGSTARAAGDVRYVQGIGGLFENVVEPNVRTTDGIIASQVGSLDRSIVSLNLRLDDVERRLEIRRASMVTEFTRMEAAMSRLQSQGNWLTSQISAFNKGS